MNQLRKEKEEIEKKAKKYYNVAKDRRAKLKELQSKEMIIGDLSIDNSQTSTEKDYKISGTMLERGKHARVNPRKYTTPVGEMVEAETKNASKSFSNTPLPMPPIIKIEEDQQATSTTSSEMKKKEGKER